MLELDDESKIIKTINDYRNTFLAASWVRWTEQTLLKLIKIILSHSILSKNRQSDVIVVIQRRLLTLSVFNRRDV